MGIGWFILIIIIAIICYIMYKFSHLFDSIGQLGNMLGGLATNIVSSILGKDVGKIFGKTLGGGFKIIGGVFRTGGSITGAILRPDRMFTKPKKTFGKIGNSFKSINPF